tara:strand:+ start:267 stop:767 length:501 start_codon:yes stop_codon:yes gene_type:complete
MFKLLLSVFIIFTGCASVSMNKETNNIFKEKYHYGILSEAIIKNHDGYPWFNKNYEKYKPNTEKLDTTLINKLSIKIFMGTWCHDSKREVPRFYKILNTINYDQKNLQIVGLKKNKKGYFNDYSNYNIKNTPTFIFFQDGNEIGRIVEKPKGSLELQIQNIQKKIQ